MGKEYIDYSCMSNVDFCKTEQLWHVKFLNGIIVYKHQNREKAIEEAIRLFSLGGKFNNYNDFSLTTELGNACYYPVNPDCE